MHSWVFRNRRRLEAIYARRRASLAPDGSSSGGSSLGGSVVTVLPGLPEADREGLRVVVLFPRRSPVLPAA